MLCTCKVNVIYIAMAMASRNYWCCNKNEAIFAHKSTCIRADYFGCCVMFVVYRFYMK